MNTKPMMTLIIPSAFAILMLASISLMSIGNLGQITTVQAKSTFPSSGLEEPNKPQIGLLTPQARAVGAANGFAGSAWLRGAKSISATQYMGDDLPHPWERDHVLTNSSGNFVGGEDKLDKPFWVVTVDGLEGRLPGPAFSHLNQLYPPKSKLYILIDGTTFEYLMAHD